MDKVKGAEYEMPVGGGIGSDQVILGLSRSQVAKAPNQDRLSPAKGVSREALRAPGLFA